MCPSLLSLLGLGLCVSLRIWAAVGKYEKLSLSAWPSPMVPLEQNVTLRCHSRSPLNRFRLFKTDGKRRLPELQGYYFNNFTLGPVTKEHAGSYMCSVANWSALSDPLQIVVTGVSTKPTISAHPGPLVQVGQNVTLRCHSLVWFDNFTLHQENSTELSQRPGQMLTGEYAAADFFIGPMTLASAGTYRCYGSLRRSPYEWSAPSDPVDIIITAHCGTRRPAVPPLGDRDGGRHPDVAQSLGRSKKPSLSAQGGPVVRSGENVTLVCSSESTFDQFHLLREGGGDLGHLLAARRVPRGALQAEFPLGPGTPAHSRVYRCYGSFTRSPYSWSDSSDPLFLSVTGSTTSTCPSTMDPHTTEEAPLPQEHSSMWHIVLGLSIAFTSISIILSALVCHWCSTQNHVAIMEGEPMEDRTVNGEDSAVEDVIYAHLDLGTLSKRQSTPTSLRPMHPFTEPIIYEEFNINQDHAEP